MSNDHGEVPDRRDDFLPPIDPTLPVIIGYEIENELGRGGMGVVYQARQTELGMDRLVALKMILAGEHASAQERERFLIEAQAVGRLPHPNIVQLLNVGTHDGLPYFALEFLEGGNLETKLDGKPLPPRQAAVLVETLAQAMHFAHLCGVVHRDLKPANVLLTLDGIPKISDFGLAKLLEKTSGQTQTGAVLGTPSYMAPEQAGGRTKEIGPATDVYALGAILYKCLTGHPPFAEATPWDTIFKVLQDEPEPLSRRQPKVPSDLAVICLKCLRKQPHQRYASALGLAEDLQRFLANQPIQARSVSRVERLGKWCQRHPTGTALILVSVFLFLGVVGWAVWASDAAQRESGLRQDAEKQSGLAKQRQREAEEHQDDAQKQLLRAVQVVQDMYTHYGEHVLRDRPHLDEVRRELLEKALTFFEALTREKGKHPTIRRQAGQAHIHCADIHYLLGKLDAAETEAKTALEWIRNLPESPVQRGDLATAHEHLARVLQAKGQVDPAIKAYLEARRLRQQFAREEQSGISRRLALARLLQELGSVYQTAERLQLAEEAYKDTLTILTDLLGKGAEKGNRPANGQPLDDFREARHTQARTLHGLAVLYHRHSSQFKERTADIEKHFQVAANLCDALVLEQPQVSRYQRDAARARLDLATWYANKQRRKDAEKKLMEAIERLRKLVADHPTIPSYQHILGVCLNNLGNVYLLQKDWDKSEPCYREARQWREQLVRLYPAEVVYQAELGAVVSSQGRYEDHRARLSAALELYHEAIRSLSAAYKRNTQHRESRWYLRNAHAWRAGVLTRLERPLEALDDWQRAFDLDDGTMAPEYWGGRGMTFTKVKRQLEALREKIRAGAFAEGGEAVATFAQAGLPAALRYELARVYVALVSEAETREPKLAIAYRMQALEQLTRAAAEGFFAKAEKRQTLLIDNREFDVLRAQTEFQKILLGKGL